MSAFYNSNKNIFLEDIYFLTRTRLDFVTKKMEARRLSGMLHGLRAKLQMSRIGYLLMRVSLL